MKKPITQVTVDGYIYEVNMLPIPEKYSNLVVEELIGGAYWIMQIDNIHDIDQDNQYNITATTDIWCAKVLGVPLSL